MDGKKKRDMEKKTEKKKEGEKEGKETCGERTMKDGIDR